MGFVEHDGLMLIDEIQLTPQLPRPIKLEWTSTRRPADSC